MGFAHILLNLFLCGDSMLLYMMWHVLSTGISYVTDSCSLAQLLAAIAVHSASPQLLDSKQLLPSPLITSLNKDFSQGRIPSACLGIIVFGASGGRT